MWKTIAFDTTLDFDKGNYAVEYDGLIIEISRGSRNKCHNLYVEFSQDDESSIIATKALRFLSELSWLFNTRVDYLFSGGGGRKTPCQIDDTIYVRIKDAIHLEDYEQVATSSKQQLALSIYREGISSSNKFYKFLSYFRIINITQPTGTLQINWINDNKHLVSDRSGIIRGLQQNGKLSIGEHLYVSRRCAIAHASFDSSQEIADPDKITDIEHIAKELDLIKELAELIINRDLNVPTLRELRKRRMTRYFRQLFGEDLVSDTIAGQAIPNEIFPQVPVLRFRLFEIDEEFEVFHSLFFVVERVDNGIVRLSNQNQDYPVKVTLEVDFRNNEVRFDGLTVVIYKTRKDLTREMLLSYYRFLRHYLLNGRLEIYPQIGSELLSRLNPYLPVNLDIRSTMDKIEKEIKHLEVGLGE